MMRHLDQAAAIMIAIKHCGDVQPGQKCSAVFFDKANVEQEKAFYAKFCSGNGVEDRHEIERMVAMQVHDEPYWLVAFKPKAGQGGEVRFHCVDDQTGRVIE